MGDSYVLTFVTVVGDEMLPRAGELFSWFESRLGISAMAERSIVREFEREFGEVGRLE